MARKRSESEFARQWPHFSCYFKASPERAGLKNALRRVFVRSAVHLESAFYERTLSRLTRAVECRSPP
jgi:hypothetical protein